MDVIDTIDTMSELDHELFGGDWWSDLFGKKKPEIPLQPIPSEAIRAQYQPAPSAPSTKPPIYQIPGKAPSTVPSIPPIGQPSVAPSIAPSMPVTRPFPSPPSPSSIRPLPATPSSQLTFGPSPQPSSPGISSTMVPTSIAALTAPPRPTTQAPFRPPIGVPVSAEPNFCEKASPKNIPVIKNKKIFLFFYERAIPNWTIFKSDGKIITSLADIQQLLKEGRHIIVKKDDLLQMVNTEAYIGIEDKKKLELINIPKKSLTKTKSKTESRSGGSKMIKLMPDLFKKLSHGAREYFIPMYIYEINREPNKYQILYNNLRNPALNELINQLASKPDPRISREEMMIKLNTADKYKFDYLYNTMKKLDQATQSQILREMLREINNNSDYHNLSGGSEILCNKYPKIILRSELNIQRIGMDIIGKYIYYNQSLKDAFESLGNDKIINTIFIMEEKDDNYIILDSLKYR